MVEPSLSHRIRDAARNHRHQRALRTLSQFLGPRDLDYAEFLHGALVCGWICPF